MTLNSLTSIFNEQIIPILKSYDVYRKKQYEKHITFVWIISFFVLLGCLFFLYIFFPDSMSFLDNYINQYFEKFFVFSFILAGILPTIAFLAPLLYAQYITKKNKEFQLTLKADCLGKILKIFGDIKWKNDSQKDEYEKCNWISDDSLNSSGLFIPFNRRSVDDEFKGSWKGVDYTISETQLLDIHGSGKNTRCIEAFKGIVIRFKCNKTIKNRTIVATKGNMTQKNTVAVTVLMAAAGCIELFKEGFSWFGLTIACIILLVAYFGAKLNFGSVEPLNEVILEDSAFNKKFNVYSSDQVEARYLVTPSFMERLYNLKTSFGAKVIKCSFYNDYLMIAISTKKDLFELGDLFHSLLEPKSQALIGDLYSILRLAEHFKLNEKVGL